MPIRVDKPNYIRTERRTHCPVEFWAVDRETKKVIQIQQFDKLNIKKSEDEENAKIQRIVQSMIDRKEKDQQNFNVVKYTAEQLKNCRENATLLGENKVQHGAELEFMINKWLG